VSPLTHGLLSWLVASAAPIGRRERAVVTLAGVAPDLDGLGAVAEIATRSSEHPLRWFSLYHHWLCHNLLTASVVACIGFALCRQRMRVAVLVFATFHLHLVCDLVGARGPDGHQWPIWYFGPFSRAWPITWSGQWQLNAWPNFVISGIALMATVALAWRRGYSSRSSRPGRMPQWLVPCAGVSHCDPPIPRPRQGGFHSPRCP
jgi:inner membrane protein